MSFFPLIMGLASAGVSAYGQQMQATAQAESAKYNAKMAEYQGYAAEAQSRRDAERHLGMLRAARAKSGATAEGTPLMVMAESAANAEVDALNARWSAQTQSQMYRASARSAKQAGQIGAGTTLLAGASRATTGY